MINECLEKIKKAVYGKDVRQSIYDAILQCYEDATGHPESVASVVQELRNLEAQINNIIANATTTEGNTELLDIRTDIIGGVHKAAGRAVRTQVAQIIDELSNPKIKKFIKENNLVKMADVSAVNATDGLIRSFSKSSINPAGSILDGTFHAIKVPMRISDYMTLEAGKTYTVYAYAEPESEVNFTLFLYDAAGNCYQEGGVNKPIAKTITAPFGTLTPEIDGEYYIGCYLNFEKTFMSDSLYVYIVEGDYTLDDFFFLYTRDEINTIIDKYDMINVPKDIAEKNLSIMKTTKIVENNNVIRSSTKCSKSLSLLSGNFPAYTFTPIGDIFTIQPDTVYTAYASSNFKTNARIVLVKQDGNLIQQNGKNVALYASGVSQFVSETSEVVQACIYSFIDQNFDDEAIALYILKGEYTMPDFCKHVTREEIMDVVENLSDITRYKNGILTKNLLAMTTDFFDAASAVPSPIDKSITKLSGKIDGLTISNEFEMTAGTTYTVCCVDNVKDINYSVFFKNVAGATMQEGGVNKGFNVTNDGYFGTFTPDTTGKVRAFLYNKNRETVSDRYLRILVLEGVYTLADLLQTTDSDATPEFDYAAYGLPVLRFYGSTSGMSKENEVVLDYDFEDFAIAGTCTMKWQGSSSIRWPKKNYTIKLDNKFEAVPGWGSQKKYCLKANYIDYSHARNVVSAKLWGQIVKSRSVRNDNLYDLTNGGAVDGFPVVVVINGVYQGIYTLNIPKDKWMMNMGDGDAEYMITAEQHDIRTAFKQAITLEELQSEQYFAIEHAPDGVEDQTILDSLNNLINACINGGENYRETVEQYMDMDSAIDYFIFTCLLCGGDMTNKNYILATYDGAKWFLSAYDLDSTFGNYWDGRSYNEASHTPMFVNYSNMNRLMKLIYSYDKEALKARYVELRETVLSEENVMYMFYNFVAGIPKALCDEEVKIWPGIPGTQTNNLSQIMDFYRLRVKALDAEIEAL